MSYLTLKVENGDLYMNQDNQLVLIRDNEGLSQQYQILLETQFESDYRDPYYGFKLQELMNSDYDDRETLLRLYIIEVLSQHSRTKEVSSIEIEKLEDRRYSARINILINDTEENISLEANLGV